MQRYLRIAVCLGIADEVTGDTANTLNAVSPLLITTVLDRVQRTMILYWQLASARMLFIAR